LLAPDGGLSPAEDFSNNLESFIFDKTLLRIKSPRLLDWFETTYGDKIKSIGSAPEIAVKRFGTAHETTLDANGKTLIYSHPHQGKLGTIHLPYMTLTYDSTDRLVAKNLQLLQNNKKLSISEVKARYPNSHFELKYPSDWSKSHSFSSERFLIDKSMGLTIKYNISRDDEVQSISWYTTDTASRGLLPASNL
jgi:hypothetical protein